MGKHCINIEFYANRWGKSLCISDKDGSGYRLGGVDMDGTNKKVVGYTVDADKLIDRIKETMWEVEE